MKGPPCHMLWDTQKDMLWQPTYLHVIQHSCCYVAESGSQYSYHGHLIADYAFNPYPSDQG